LFDTDTIVYGEESLDVDAFIAKIAEKPETKAPDQEQSRAEIPTSDLCTSEEENTTCHKRSASIKPLKKKYKRVSANDALMELFEKPLNEDTFVGILRPALRIFHLASPPQKLLILSLPNRNNIISVF
jgi:hypothetical protein